MKRRRLSVLLIALLAVPLGAYIVSWFVPGEAVIEVNASKVEVGMTELEVIEILGRPPDETDRWFDYDEIGRKPYAGDWLKTWRSKDTYSAIFTQFNKNGVVTHVRFFRYPKHTFLDKVRSFVFHR